jgi:polyhydroxyalkanoate synthesis regulator protein
MQNVVSRYIEQSITTFIDHEQRYRARIQDLAGAAPMTLMRKALEQNMEFWNRLANSTINPPNDKK